MLNAKNRYLDSSDGTYRAWWSILQTNQLWPSWYNSISHRCS